MDPKEFLNLNNLYLRSLKNKKIRKKQNQRLRLLINHCADLQMKINAAIVCVVTSRSSNSNKIRVMPELLPPKSEGHWEMVGRNLPDSRFQKKYRVNRKTFDYICNVVRGDLYRSNTIMREATSVEKRVIIALHILKSNCDLGTVADLYKVGKSSVGHILQEFCDSLVKNLYEQEVRFPVTEIEQDSISKIFLNNWKFPGTFGALDGTHIPIKKPETSGEDYFNYKHYYSIVVLAFADANYCFRYFNVGRPGGVHDAVVFRDSKLSEYFERNTIKNHIIADGAFPLRNWLLKPYPITTLTPIKEHFNFRLSSARMTIEDSFGRLKGRMRILSKRMDFSLEHCKQIVKACVIIHNLCERNRCQFYASWLHKSQVNAADFNVPQRIISDRRNADGLSKRDSLAKMLFQEIQK